MRGSASYSSLISALWFACVSAAGASCYTTPADAVEAARSGASNVHVSEVGGYWVTGVQSDPLLGHRWAKAARCDHPEWPALSLPLAASDQIAGAQRKTGIHVDVPVVHVGETVHVWKQEALLRIELAGISHDNGSVGAKIRVRPLHGNPEVSPEQAIFYGIVRGPSDVEMQP